MSTPFSVTRIKSPALEGCVRGFELPGLLLRPAVQATTVVLEITQKDVTRELQYHSGTLVRIESTRDDEAREQFASAKEHVCQVVLHLLQDADAVVWQARARPEPGSRDDLQIFSAVWQALEQLFDDAELGLFMHRLGGAVRPYDAAIAFLQRATRDAKLLRLVVTARAENEDDATSLAMLALCGLTELPQSTVLPPALSFRPMPPGLAASVVVPQALMNETTRRDHVVLAPPRRKALVAVSVLALVVGVGLGALARDFFTVRFFSRDLTASPAAAGKATQPSRPTTDNLDAPAMVLIEEAERLLAAHEANQALVLLRQASDLNPTHPLLHRGLGTAHMLLGDQIPALVAYRRYLELRPNASDRGDIEAKIELLQR